MKLKAWLVGCLLAGTVGTALAQSPFLARFDPAAGIVPSATNLLFAGSADGTLNIPVQDPATAPIVEAVNGLDGFSTVAPIVTEFSAAIDPASLLPGVTVRIFEVDLNVPFLNPLTPAPFAVHQAVAELGAAEFDAGVLAVDPNGATLEITPRRPLKPKTGYMVVLTDGIRSTAGLPAAPDRTYIFSRFRGGSIVDENNVSLFPSLSDAQAQQLDALRRVIVSQEDAAADAGVERGTIVFSFSFLTQSTGDVLSAVAANALPQSMVLAPSGLTTADLGFGLPGLADIYAGTFQAPYFLEAPTSVPTVILSTGWQGANESNLTRYNPLPVARVDALSMPLLATLPNALDKPATGWPVVIVQHGITRNRTDLLLFADVLAGAGLAAVAIDLPLHGVTDTASPFYRNGQERTFNADLINNETNAPGADGTIDPSGSHFINLNSLVTSRDNLRQGAADLHNLLATLRTADIDGDGSADFDPARVSFWGNSLGGIVGGVFLGADQDAAVHPAALTVTGGGIARLLEGSERFGPVIQGGLASVGIVDGTPEYEAFFRAAQHVIDAGDVINYGADVADARPVLLIEVLDDEVIPNSVAGAPLSGTEPLATVMGLQAIDESASAEAGLRALVRIVEGSHGSPLSPTAGSAAATLEIQSQVAAFLAGGGTSVPIANPSVVQPVP